nr:MAG TPA: holin [Caudoviricetes sp.]
MIMNEVKIDWKRKLTSRKFWVAVGGFITAILVALHIDQMTIEQVTAIVSAMATLIAYIIGEGLTDAAHKEEREGKDD